MAEDPQDQQDTTPPDLREMRTELAAELAVAIEHVTSEGISIDEWSQRAALVRDIAQGLDALDRVIAREPIPQLGHVEQPNLDALYAAVWNVVAETGHPTSYSDFAVDALRAAQGDAEAADRLTGHSGLR